MLLSHVACEASNLRRGGTGTRNIYIVCEGTKGTLERETREEGRKKGRRTEHRPCVRVRVVAVYAVMQDGGLQIMDCGDGGYPQVPTTTQLEEDEKENHSKTKGSSILQIGS